MTIPLRSFAILLISLFWLFVSITQWLFNYYDLSNLLFAMGFFLVGLYAAYDQWYKHLLGENIDDMYHDIQAIDKKCNDLETKVIIIKNGMHNKKRKW